MARPQRLHPRRRARVPHDVINSRGDEAMGTVGVTSTTGVWVSGDWEDSPAATPRAARRKWWNWHDRDVPDAAPDPKWVAVSDAGEGRLSQKRRLVRWAAQTSLPSGSKAHWPRASAEWLRLSLAARTTFAIGAVTAIQQGGMPGMLCAAAHDASPLTGMVPMYPLMSVFHSMSWPPVITHRRVRRASQADLDGWQARTATSVTQAGITPKCRPILGRRGSVIPLQPGSLNMSSHIPSSPRPNMPTRRVRRPARPAARRSERDGPHYRVNGVLVCASCTQRLREQLPAGLASGLWRRRNPVRDRRGDPGLWYRCGIRAGDGLDGRLHLPRRRSPRPRQGDGHGLARRRRPPLPGSGGSLTLISRRLAGGGAHRPRACAPRQRLGLPPVGVLVMIGLASPFLEMSIPHARDHRPASSCWSACRLPGTLTAARKLDIVGVLVSEPSAAAAPG